MRCWVPVSERLPELPKGYLEVKCMFQIAETGTIFCGYYGEKGLWRDKYFRH